MLVVCLLTSFLLAQSRDCQQGTVVRMRMTECVIPQHGFMSAMAGSGRVEQGILCPEYVLVTDRVVYVISGKNSEQLIPLAEVTRYRLQKNEMMIRVDDASKESHFRIKAMVLRPEWDHNQILEDAQAADAARHHLDIPLVTGSEQ